ncbi:MAG: ankyrin repeat domain-containing protein [Zoogloeaceae bacterium]|jgi:hypothetical protein|nr:ankyrin repeat domain-containing protein [Zoogloeaceae bacterium]
MSHQLRRAAQAGNIEALRLRLEAGDDIESRDKGTGRTVLLEAVIAGHMEAVLFLLEKGADKNASCKAVGLDSLGWAVQTGNDALVDILLAAGADANHVPANAFLGRTALMRAAQTGHLDIAKRLIAAGADPRALDRAGNCALALAEHTRHDALAAYLKAMGGAVSPPPPPKTIAWPEIGWKEDAALPNDATPAQVARGFILARYRWETDAWRRRKEAAFDLNATIDETHAIRARYCTGKKRVYVTASIGPTPTFHEDLDILCEQYPNPRKCEIRTRNMRAKPKSIEDGIEIQFILFKKKEGWRIDSAQRRWVGARSWERMIL